MDLGDDFVNDLVVQLYPNADPWAPDFGIESSEDVDVDDLSAVRSPWSVDNGDSSDSHQSADDECVAPAPGKAQAEKGLPPAERPSVPSLASVEIEAILQTEPNAEVSVELGSESAGNAQPEAAAPQLWTTTGDPAPAARDLRSEPNAGSSVVRNPWSVDTGDPSDSHRSVDDEWVAPEPGNAEHAALRPLPAEPRSAGSSTSSGVKPILQSQPDAEVWLECHLTSVENARPQASARKPSTTGTTAESARQLRSEPNLAPPALASNRLRASPPSMMYLGAPRAGP
jgi:hypothetical protein